MTRKILTALAFTAVIILAGCGHGDSNAPAPTPGIPNGYPGSACSGIPVSQSGAPFTANLMGMGGFNGGGSIGDSISISICTQQYGTNPYSYQYQQSNSITANGSITLSELANMNSGYSYNSAPQTVGINATTPGTINMQQSNYGGYNPYGGGYGGGSPYGMPYGGGPTIQVNLMGTTAVQIPYYPANNPYGGGYPQQPTYQSQTQNLTVSLGYSCPVTLNLSNNHLSGCVLVQIGQSGQTLQFQAQ